MNRGLVLAGALAALAFPGRAAEGCRGTLSGKVSGSFACKAQVVTLGEGRGVFVLQALGPVDGVPAYQPGSFEIALPPRPGVFGLAELGMGKASVAAEDGAYYSATRTTGQRGEVVLVLRSVKPQPGTPGTWALHGTYRARLLPAGSGKEGEVRVEASF